MKEFEKWLLNTKHVNFTWEEDTRDAWKAALECILKKINNDMYMDSDDIRASIEKELKQ
jgi:hypothetical protein